MTPESILQNGHVFPLAPATRRPLIKWRAGSAKGSAAFPNHNGPWGLDCGKSGLVVIDVDHKGGKAEGLANLPTLGELPDTFTVKTRTGGLHLYFSNREGAPVSNSASKIAKDIDVRGDGGFVVVYEEVVNAAKIAPLPDSLRELCGKPMAVNKKELETEIELDQPRHIAQAVAYAQEAKPAIEGDAGDQLTLHIALGIKDLGITEETALEILLTEWNDRCEPPWDVEELEQKIRNAYEYGKRAPGAATTEHKLSVSNATTEEAFADVQPVPMPVNPPKPAPKAEVEEVDDGPRPASSYAFGQAPKRKWLINDFIPLKSVCSIYGAPGCGKSLAAVELGECISEGTPWYGQPIEHPAPVLYVSCEDDDDELHLRLDAVRRKEIHSQYAGEEEHFHIWDRVGKDSMLAISTQNGPKRKEFLERLEIELMRIAPKGEHRVLIIDTVTDVSQLNENDRNEVSYFVKFILGGLSTRHNCTVIFLAHPSKSSDYSGSTAWQGSVRAQLYLKYHEEDTDLRWLTRGKTNRSKRTGENEGLLLRWEDHAFVEIDSDAFEADQVAQQRRAVFNALEQATRAGNCMKQSGNASNPIKNHQWLDENGVEIPLPKVKKIINSLIDEGSVDDEKGRGLVATQMPLITGDAF